MTADWVKGGLNTVFIVEDNEESLRGMAEALKGEGYSVTALSNFEEAHRRLLTETPDALLLDIRLGAFNGLHLALIAREQSSTMKILVFSGFVDPVLISEVEALGAKFMAKPLDYDEVLQVLRS